MKKPGDPPKPKLDEEERLDPKDDLKLPAGETRDEQEILERIARNARTSEDRLGNRELGEGTRDLQQEIIKDIDSLIERSKNQDQNNQQNQQNQQNQNQQNQDKKNQQNRQGASSGSSGPGGQRQSASQQRRQRRQSARQRGRQQGNDVARNTQPNQDQGTGTNPGGGGTSTGGAKDKPTDRAFDLWGHLPEKERALMQKEMEQKFMDKYDDLTKQYYRIIAEKSRLNK